MKPVIIAHGGIESATADGFSEADKQSALKKAVIKGYSKLRSGESSLHAVEETIRMLEDNKHFNAGYGSALNADGEAELDAGIMNGCSLRVGSVGAVKDVAHPITLAKLVMNSTEHSLLVGEGARKFALRKGVPQLSPGVLAGGNVGQGSQETGTVGVVAIDSQGRCAAGTSSGGGCGKLPGRVGSSAIVGGGFYADSSIGGSVATGHGESIVQSCLCFNVISQMAVQSLQGSLTMLVVKNVVEAVTRKTRTAIGAIALDTSGEFGVAFSAPRMPWVYCRMGVLRFGAASGENYSEYV